jgi:hypothetical protein
VADIHRPHDAILAAAHLLAAHGAIRDIAAALYAYNPSWRYVDAVLRATPAGSATTRTP